MKTQNYFYNEDINSKQTRNASKIILNIDNKENKSINNLNIKNYIYRKKNIINNISSLNNNKKISKVDFQNNIVSIMSYNDIKKKENKTKNNKSMILFKKSNSYSLSLSPGVPYRRVGNIFSRNENRFYKNKKIKNIKSIFKKSQSCNFINTQKIKKLKGENHYLKKMIKISENKINLKQNILEQLLILQKKNEMDDNCPASIQQIQKIISPLNKFIKNMKDNKDIYLINNQNREPISLLFLIQMIVKYLK